MLYYNEEMTRQFDARRDFSKLSRVSGMASRESASQPPPSVLARQIAMGVHLRVESSAWKRGDGAELLFGKCVEWALKCSEEEGEDFSVACVGCPHERRAAILRKGGYGLVWRQAALQRRGVEGGVEEIGW